VVCENSSPGLRGVTIIELEHAAEALTAPNRACADQRGLGRDALITEILVGPFLMIVSDKRSYGGTEVWVANSQLCCTRPRRNSCGRESASVGVHARVTPAGNDGIQSVDTARFRKVPEVFRRLHVTPPLVSDTTHDSAAAIDTT
jgi:hypothetical protein